jgi:hypothetical protein
VESKGLLVDDGSVQLQEHKVSLDPFYVVLITNQTKSVGASLSLPPSISPPPSSFSQATHTHTQVALWRQKASRRSDGLVVWDYHVILLEKTTQGGLIYDLDTTLPYPSSLTSYVKETFAETLPKYRSFFRVVPADEFLANFSSDRSHMLVAGSTTKYLAPPPTYPCIQRNGVATNLFDKFLNIQDTTYGTVMNLDQFVEFGGNSKK